MTKNEKHPILCDVYPDKAQYGHGEEVMIRAEVYNTLDNEAEIKLSLRLIDLCQQVELLEKTLTLKADSKETIEFYPICPTAEWPAYGVDMDLYFGGEKVDCGSTAFDRAAGCNDVIRYGFLSEFYQQDEDECNDVTQLSKYHINRVQFYDWMYRHEDLIPKTAFFLDPLNRELSRKAILQKITACREHGMKTMAYGAIYGAGKAFYELHPDWALYCNNGTAQSFGQWLYIMNIAPDSPWTDHIIGEYKKALEQMHFDGIHLDTYGWPKSAYSMLSGKPRLEQLNEHFPSFVSRVRDELGRLERDVHLTFNAVGNWPIEALAQLDLEALYIEVWDPCERYFHLYQLVSRARELSRKQVVLAAYLKPFDQDNLVDAVYAQKATGEPYDEIKAQIAYRLCSAVIFASGGYHFILGENNGILTNNYYVRYGSIGKDFEPVVRGYQDFIVRYGFLLFSQCLRDISMTHANGINDEFIFTNGAFSSYGEPNRVWTLVKEMPGYKVIHLINLCGLESDLWNEGKKELPAIQKDIGVKALINERIRGVWLASPDINSGRPAKLKHESSNDSFRGSYTSFSIPELTVWDLIFIELEE